MSQDKKNQFSRRDLLKSAGYITLGATSLGALIGCGSKGSDKPAAPAAGGSAPAVTGVAKPTLKVWLFKSFVTASNSILEKQIKTWAEKKNVNVEIEFSTFNDIFTKYAAAIEAGNPPDVGELDHLAPVRYKGMGQLLPITDVVNKIKEMSGGFTNENRINAIAQHDKEYWALPRYSLLSMFFARKDLLDAKGLKIPDTWEEVVDVAKKVQDVNAGIYGFGQTVNRSFDGDGWMSAVLWGHGASWTDTTGTKVTLDSPETRIALQFAVDTYKVHKVQPPGAEGWTDSSNNEAWLAGKLAMTNNGASIYYALESQKHALTDKTRLAITPKGPKGRFTEDVVYNLGIFKKSKNPELAKELLIYLNSPEQWVEYMKSSSGQAAPVYANHAKESYWTSNPNYTAARDNGEFARAIGYPGPVTPAAAEVRAQHVLTDMASQVLQGTKIDDAVKAAHKRVETIYKAVK